MKGIDETSARFYTVTDRGIVHAFESEGLLAGWAATAAGGYRAATVSDIAAERGPRYEYMQHTADGHVYLMQADEDGAFAYGVAR